PILRCPVPYTVDGARPSSCSMRTFVPVFSALGRAAMAVMTISLAPKIALACACGCGVFDVSSSPTMAGDGKGSIFFEYDFLNQNKNWSGDHSAPTENNDDKRIRTSFYNIGGQYMFTPQ